MPYNGTIATSITLYIDTYNEMERLRGKTPRSAFIQSAVRQHINRVKKRNVLEILSELDQSELELLKNEIKKRG